MWFERRFGGRLSAWRDRARSVCLRWRGARLAARVRIGRRCEFERPWCLTVGTRSRFEQQVLVKATTDGAQIERGADVFVGYNSEFDISESLRVGAGALIAPGCFITDHAHRCAADRRIAEQGCAARPVVIGEDVWLGAGVVVLAGVHIGHGAVVGAGAVVNRDVAPMAIVAGVPAQVIGRRGDAR